MNAAINSTRPAPGATTKQTYLNMLDTLDEADRFMLAIQLISPAQVNGDVIDTLAAQARVLNDRLRAFLEAGVNEAGAAS